MSESRTVLGKAEALLLRGKRYVQLVPLRTFGSC